MDYYWSDIFILQNNSLNTWRSFLKRWRTFWKSLWCFLENSLTNSWMRLGALESLPWRVCLFVKTCNTVTLSCHPERSEGSREHKAMNNKVYAHEILRRKAPLDDKIENFHIESHTQCNGSPYTRKSVRSCCRCVETHLQHLSRWCGRWSLPVADDLPP